MKIAASVSDHAKTSTVKANARCAPVPTSTAPIAKPIDAPAQNATPTRSTLRTGFSERRGVAKPATVWWVGAATNTATKPYTASSAAPEIHNSALPADAPTPSGKLRTHDNDMPRLSARQLIHASVEFVGLHLKNSTLAAPAFDYNAAS